MSLAPFVCQERDGAALGEMEGNDAGRGGGERRDGGSEERREERSDAPAQTSLPATKTARISRGGVQEIRLFWQELTAKPI